MAYFDFWQRWLFGVSLVIIIFGILLALLNQTPIFDLVFNNQINPVFWGAPQVPNEIVAFQGWIYGVLGATVAGWGVFLAFIAHYPFRQRQRWAWNSIAVGLCGWYVLDTIISISFGVYFNAIFNTLLLVAGFAPLFFTRKAFSATKPS